MRLLVIGGTVFVGRAVVETALARGDEVTVFHRGVHGAGLFGDVVETVLGDRERDLGRLAGRSWDAVVDTCGFTPEAVGASARALAGVVDRYVFVSTAGVYADWPEAPIGDESASLHENIGRLPYWLSRMARGGAVLAPGPADATIQLVDARDLAEWMLTLPAPGPYSAIAPPGIWTWRGLLETCRDVVRPDAELVWTDGERVAAALEDPWRELPLWPAPLPDLSAVFSVGTEKALAAGLRIRPLRDTVADTWAWLQASGGDVGGKGWREEVRAIGLSAERERELLAMGT